MKPFTCCSFCGTTFDKGNVWPKTCGSCGNTTWRNPLPVAVLLIPCDGRLVGVRRANDPQKGNLALPGGFITLGESWQVAAAREAREETFIAIDPNAIKLFDVHSAPDGTVLIFGIAPTMRGAELPEYAPTDETCERVLLGKNEALAFPIHEDVVRSYFLRREKNDQ